MHSSNKRRLFWSGSSVLAIFVVTMSVAWACTSFVGGMSLTGNGTGNVALDIAAQTPDGCEGGHGPIRTETDCPNGMDQCGFDTMPTAGDPDVNQSAFWTVRVNGSNPDMTVDIINPDDGIWGNTLACSNQGSFPAGSTYTVKLHTGYMWGSWGLASNPNANHNCHGGSESPYGASAGGTTIDTSYVIDGTGNGSEHFTSAQIGTLSTGWYSVCVMDANDGLAMSQNFKVV